MADHLTIYRLKQVLGFNPDTGTFTWKIALSNNTAVGAIAGYQRKGGYLVINIDGRSYVAQRLVWFYVTEEWPLDELDHRDLNKGNNRFENLRPASHSNNAANCHRRKDNTSGHKGVSFDKRRGKWAAYINCNGARHSLGYHDSAIVAGSAYCVAADRLFGEFARHQ